MIPDYGGHCLLQRGEWFASYDCAHERPFLCASANPPNRRSGNHTIILGNDLLKSPTIFFWWDHSPDSDSSETPGFKLSWQVENGSLPDVREFVSKELSGCVSTPGLGSLPPPNYYKERHEYTAVIELPHNITDVIDTLVVDVNVAIPGNQTDAGVELLSADPKVESTYMEHDTQLVFTGKNLSVPALLFKWVTQPNTEDHSQGNSKAGKVKDKDNSDDKIIGGFIIEWHVKESNTIDDNGHINKEQGWVQKYDPVENTGNMLTLMKIVRESKRNNVEEKVVWKSLLKHRWSSEIIRDSPCLDEDEEYGVILKTAKELNLDFGVNSWVPSEDLALGKDLFSIIKCQFPAVEVAKLSQLIKHLLTSQSLNTVVASTMHNIKPMAENNIKDFTAINMWYERLDKRYNFSLGAVLLPLLKTDNLTQLAKLNPPYLKNIKASIDEHQLENIVTALGKNLSLIHTNMCALDGNVCKGRHHK